MKNKILLFFFSFFIAAIVTAQQPGFNSVSEAAEIAGQILTAAGKKANFQIREANVPNAVAVLYNGKRYILYNPDFISKLTRLTGTKWAAISVLAHEIGHHLYTHTVNGKTIPMASELEADEFSGFVLRKMGASLEDAQAAMRTLASTRATATHPARHERLGSIAEGWEDADGAEETVAVAQPTREAILDSRYILADINFTADPHTSYHVTTQLNVVKVKDNRLYKVGKLTKLNSSRFPYMIYDESNTRVYVGSSGEIVNRRGGTIGSLTLHRS